jgi:hypothetical protein
LPAKQKQNFRNRWTQTNPNDLPWLSCEAVTKLAMTRLILQITRLPTSTRLSSTMLVRHSSFSVPLPLHMCQIKNFSSRRPVQVRAAMLSSIGRARSKWTMSHL